MANENLNLLNQLAGLRFGPQALEALADQTAAGFEAWCVDAWQAWSACEFRECAFFEPSAPWTARLWGAAPEVQIAALLELRPSHSVQLPVGVFNASQYGSYLAHAAHVPLQVWRDLPESVLESAIDSLVRLEDERGAQVLWSRFPEALLKLLDEILAQEEYEAADLLLNASPTRLGDVVVSRLRHHLKQRALADPLVGFLRQWLYDQVRSRTPYWRDAYAALAELERRLNSVASVIG